MSSCMHRSCRTDIQSAVSGLPGEGKQVDMAFCGPQPNSWTSLRVSSNSRNGCVRRRHRGIDQLLTQNGRRDASQEGEG